ncbi:MAG: hypothetical protein GY711_18835 [bacterium]|nr:hypothetical protein [bacterium]
MSEDNDWGNIESLPAPKEGIPKWLWCCGCGCLIPIVLLVALGGFAVKVAKDGSDTEAAWEHLAEVLPYDERPDGWTLQWGMPIPFVGVEVYIWIKDGDTPAEADPGEEPGTEPEAESDEPEQEGGEKEPVLIAWMMVAPPEVIDEFFTGSQAEGGEPFELEVQGRKLTGSRAALEDESPFPFLPDPEQGQSAAIDLTSIDADDAHMLMLIRQGSQERITDEEIREFLAPFHVGPDR